MSMGEVNIHGEIGFQYDAGIKGYIRDRNLLFLIKSMIQDAAAASAMFFRIPAVLFYHIVIAVEHIKAMLFMKTGKEKKYVAVGFHDLFHTAVFPQFIPIAQFDIGISQSIIMLQCGLV